MSLRRQCTKVRCTPTGSPETSNLGNWQGDTIAQANPVGSGGGIGALNGNGGSTGTYQGTVNPVPSGDTCVNSTTGPNPTYSTSSDPVVLRLSITGQGGQTRGERFRPRRQVFCQIVKDLGEQVGGGAGPARGFPRSLHCIAHVLTVPEAGLAHAFPRCVGDRETLPAVRPDLFAANVQFRGAVDPDRSVMIPQQRLRRKGFQG